MNRLRELLERCRDQFDFYSRQHRSKVPSKFARDTPEANETIAKAEINEGFVTAIGEALVRDPDMIHAAMVARLQKSGEAILAGLTPLKADVLHMALGACGEAGELGDAIKRWAIYGKDLDRANVVEELGDMEFFMQGLRDRLDITREETLVANHHKLVGSKTARYKDGYSDEAAIARADKQGELGLSAVDRLNAATDIVLDAANGKLSEDEATDAIMKLTKAPNT